MGCFTDTTDRDLDGPSWTETKYMTPEICIAECKTAGYAYAGVQAASDCYCGNSYGKHGTATNCDMACVGDPSKICGGLLANSVYELATPAEALSIVCDEVLITPGLVIHELDKIYKTYHVELDIKMLTSDHHTNGNTYHNIFQIGTGQGSSAYHRHPSVFTRKNNVKLDVRANVDGNANFQSYDDIPGLNTWFNYVIRQYRDTDDGEYYFEVLIDGVQQTLELNGNTKDVDNPTIWVCRTTTSYCSDVHVKNFKYKTADRNTPTFTFSY